MISNICIELLVSVSVLVIVHYCIRYISIVISCFTSECVGENATDTENILIKKKGLIIVIFFTVY